METYPAGKNADYQSIKNLALLNLGSFVDRAWKGTAVGLIGGIVESTDLSALGYLGFGAGLEASFDVVGAAPNVNKAAKKCTKYMKRLKESLKDDIGGVAGFSVGLAAGHYAGKAGKHYLQYLYSLL